MKEGSILGERYRLVRLIGEGGMGSVYEAVHININKKVAIKVLHRDFSRDEEALKRFHQEARIAGSMGHANIVEVMDFGISDDGVPYLVMEYLSGQGLKEKLKEDVVLDTGEAISILRKVLSAIGEAHINNIVHRDLKPDNILLARIKGHGEVVKILDFGISKVMISEEVYRLTKTGEVIGTPFYMSPEQIMKGTEVDHLTDIYACGVLLFEMVTGRLPFRGESYHEIIMKVTTQEPPDPMSLRPDLPEELGRIILKAMSKEKEERFSTAEEFAEALETVGQSTGRPAAGAGRRESEPAGDVSGRTVEEASIAAPPVKPAGTKKLAAMLIILAVLLAAAAGGAYLLYGVGHDRKESHDGTGQPGAGAGDRAGSRDPLAKISFLNAPEGAVIQYQGRETAASVIEVKKGGRAVSMTITAGGYEPQSMELIPDRDKEIVLNMRKKIEPPDEAGEGEKRAADKREGEGKARKTGDKVEGTGPKKGKKSYTDEMIELKKKKGGDEKKKDDFVWEYK